MVHYDDLHQAGYVAYAEAKGRYNPERNRAFWTYVGVCVWAQLQTCRNTLNRTNRVHQRQQRFNRYHATLERGGTEAEALKAAGIKDTKDKAKVLRGLDIAYVEFAEEFDNSLAHSYRDVPTLELEDEYIPFAQLLSIGGMRDWEREFLRLRFVEGWTFDMLANKMQRSKQGVINICNRLLKRMQEPLRRYLAT